MALHAAIHKPERELGKHRFEVESVEFRNVATRAICVLGERPHSAVVLRAAAVRIGWTGC